MPHHPQSTLSTLHPSLPHLIAPIPPDCPQSPPTLLLLDSPDSPLDPLLALLILAHHAPSPSPSPSHDVPSTSTLHISYTGETSAHWKSIFRRLGHPPPSTWAFHDLSSHLTPLDPSHPSSHPPTLLPPSFHTTSTLTPTHAFPPTSATATAPAPALALPGSGSGSGSATLIILDDLPTLLHLSHTPHAIQLLLQTIRLAHPHATLILRAHLESTPFSPTPQNNHPQTEGERSLYTTLLATSHVQIVGWPIRSGRSAAAQAQVALLPAGLPCPVMSAAQEKKFMVLRDTDLSFLDPGSLSL